MSLAESSMRHGLIALVKRAITLQSSSLGNNTFWLMIGNVGYLATQWGILALLAKNLNPTAVGIYSYGLALTAPLMMFASLRLRLVQATDASGEFAFADYMGLRLKTVVVALVFLLITVLVIPASPEARQVVWWIGVAKALDLFSQTCHGLWQRHERMALIAVSRILNGGCTLLCVAVGLEFTQSIGRLMLLSALVSLTVVITFDRYWALRLSRQGIQGRTDSMIWGQTTWHVQRKILWLTLPLGVTVGIGALDANLPRLLIEDQLGQSALGIYSALAYTILAASTLVDALGNAVSPRLAHYFQEQNLMAFNRLIAKISIICLAVVGLALIGVSFLGEFVLSVIYTPEYANYKHLLSLLVAAAGIQAVGTIISFGMTASREIRPQAVVQLVTLTLGVVAYWSLTAKFDLLGAGYATISIAALRTFLLYRISSRSLAAIGAKGEATHAH